MPFPWKKNRVTRISRIVADLQSPKRGGSLVVETGFPTSLIDLFVKNRSRFSKSKSKKPGRPEIADPLPPPPPPSPESNPPTTEANPPTTIPEPEVSVDSIAEPPGPSPAVEGSVEGDIISGRVGVCGGESGPNMVVCVIVKMLVVVVLIASVKRITVGITVSAFALVFLEYAGKRVVSSLGPCSNAMVKVESLAQRVTDFVSFQKALQLKVKNHCEVEILQSDALESRSNSNSLSIDEIEIVETNIESCLIGPELVPCSEFVEDFDSSKPCEVSECKIRGSRSGRFKSKMVMKLVPKRFRGSKNKKGKEEVEGESVTDVSREDKSQRFEIEEEQEDEEKEEEDEKKKGSELLLKSKIVSVKDDCGITDSQELEVEMSSEKRIDSVGNSSYRVLLVITLAGLVVGRVPALILLMAWCFMLKIVKTMWR